MSVALTGGGMDSLDPDSIHSRLTAHNTTIHPVDRDRHAAVALILEPLGSEWSVLFIERAHREGDPWSGQIAFPGGRRERQDINDEAVAIRETFEEIGLVITPQHQIGRLDDMKGRHGGTSAGMVISCFVYAVPSVQPVDPNYEVESVVRVPMRHLIDERNYVTVKWSGSDQVHFPGVSFGEGDHRVLWGLTYRFVRHFFIHLGHHLPEVAHPADAGHPVVVFG